MNDPLYGHPAWKVGEESDSVNVDHVISEIVKTNYASKSHDQTFEKGHDSRPSQLEKEEGENSVGKGSADEVVGTDRTTTSERCTVGEGTQQENVTVQTIGQNSGEDTSRMTTEARGRSVDESKGQSIATTVESKGQSAGEAADRDTQAGELVKENAESCSELGGRSHVSLASKSDAAVRCLDERDGDVSCDPDCTECKTVHADPTPSELMMYLHALSYKVRIHC